MIGYPSGQGAILSARDYPLCPTSKNLCESHIIKSFIDQACSVKMTHIGFVLFSVCSLTEMESRSMNTGKKNLANIQSSWLYTWSAHISWIMINQSEIRAMNSRWFAGVEKCLNIKKYKSELKAKNTWPPTIATGGENVPLQWELKWLLYLSNMTASFLTMLLSFSVMKTLLNTWCPCAFHFKEWWQHVQQL